MTDEDAKRVTISGNGAEEVKVSKASERELFFCLGTGGRSG